ncbi:helix-hairpin-helix domain-containing protein [Aurantiacibacter sp. MUD11]|uniref:helix-hairpin-helix domain-containing protein n=1 Tax=Aurantiacibacter sp. MUD11 TaxID=3003265 RepID=UPI0022AA7C7A|nr:helix-hairpin-helix domain-containing protein [Aurantiacibacter sp. MUD11]WAT17774.1 helix-hairpin-helix domain-containing protein [Aurantiacibacter sp. MUD11]
MVELLEANWLLVVAALVIGLLVAWWIFVVSRRTTVEREEQVEDAPAKRNQALIDAPPVAAKSPANADEVATAPLGTDAEAGSGTPMREALDKVPAAAPAGGDDLTRIKGVGPKLVTLLHENGVTSFAQIAAWDDAEIDRIDAKLGRFQGRIRRDNWMEQAKLLSGGDISAYEAKFGRTS